MKLVPGSIFARDFRVLSAVAEGGMGAVYSVEQLSTGKRRALKVMQPQLIPDARARERFVLEARIGSQIESEHVVDVVASGIDEPTGMPWIAMELLEGVDLAEHVKQRGCLPPQETYEVLSQLCDGLGAAHARGIVHRDLKPENVFISTSKRRGVPFIVKILDFGIAKVTQDNHTSATGTSAMGSPLWMAPEQTESGTRLRPATDVWALGLMTFWMLTGRSYWRAGNQAEIALTPVFTEVLVLPLDPPSVRAAQMGLGHLVPPAFDAWFFRCVARNHDQRFVDATQAIASLTPYFSLNEASSARRMIPATVAMPSVPPPAMGGAADTIASATVPTPLPRTSFHAAHESPYTPMNTEKSGPFIPPTILGGSLPPGVPVMPAHAPVASPVANPVASLPPQPSGFAPSSYPSHPSPHPHAMPVAHAIATSPMTPHAVPPHPTPYLPNVPHVAAPVARGTEGTVRWGVIGVLGATLVLGFFAMVGLALLFLLPSETPPPPTAARPDAAIVVAALTPPDAAIDEPDAGVDAGTDTAPRRVETPIAQGGSTQGGSTQGGSTQGGSQAGSTQVGAARVDPNEPFPDDSDRRFLGTWSGDGWRYSLVIDLAREGRSVRGAIRWTLAQTPDEMYTARIGETATEYVSGTLAPSGAMTLDGQSVTDDSLISADHYDLTLSATGDLSGSAREGGGRLSAHMRAPD